MTTAASSHRHGMRSTAMSPHARPSPTPCARYAELLVVLVTVVSSPLTTAQQVCTEGNTLNGGGTVAATDYANQESCSWTLVCSSGAPTLAFETFDTEANFDFMYLFEGTDSDGTVLEPGLSGDGHAPMSYTATASNSLFLVFQTDYSVTRAGFSATFTCETGQGESTCTSGNTIDQFGVINIQNYVNNLDCSWTLTCSTGTPSLAFETFDTEANFDFMYLYDGQDSTGNALVDGLSGVGHAPMAYSSDTATTMYLRFYTDGSVVRSGFLATFSCPTIDITNLAMPESSCGSGNTIDNIGAIHMQDYVNSLDCSWTLTCSTGVPTLTFETFQTEANFDFIYVYEGEDASGNALVSGLSGDDHAPMTYFTDVSNSVYLRFTTDGSVTRSGFFATFTCPQGNFYRTSVRADWETTTAECQNSGGSLVSIASVPKSDAVIT